jgi:hypothetical protein
LGQSNHSPSSFEENPLIIEENDVIVAVEMNSTWKVKIASKEEIELYKNPFESSLD